MSNFSTLNSHGLYKSIAVLFNYPQITYNQKSFLFFAVSATLVIVGAVFIQIKFFSLNIASFYALGASMTFYLLFLLFNALGLLSVFRDEKQRRRYGFLIAIINAIVLRTAASFIHVMLERLLSHSCYAIKGKWA